jgi:transcriptional regulator with PAS, ATPase and Fis domain
MIDIMSVVRKVAVSNAFVLVTGESGTGKEIVANTVHNFSQRRNGPFIDISCAAIQETLLESELFGYESGAFTGARQRKLGLLELAHGGTLFLDEIGEMNLTLQAKLLRVLETQMFFRVGGTKKVSVDVRFIAATNRNLDAFVAEGKFREDLLFRISGVTIAIPPLRDRPNEIAKLAEKLLGEECERAGKPKKQLSPDAIALLESYRWPGNVRELRSTMERAVLVAEADAIGADQLLLGTGAPRTAEVDGEDAEAVEEPGERQRIEAALEKTAGNQKEAAALLGITRRALMYRMDRYGIKRPRKKSG